MIFTETKIKGAYFIDLEKHEDERGFFARIFCKNEFAVQGLVTEFVQCSISYNEKKGTLRGMHFQVAPHEEVKIVSCTSGAIYDVILDVRENSRTYGKWIAVELSARNRTMLYIPSGVAHGFQTLVDHSVVFYQMSEFYHPESARGIHWNDERYQIEWRYNQPHMSRKDAGCEYVKSIE